MQSYLTVPCPECKEHLDVAPIVKDVRIYDREKVRVNFYVAVIEHTCRSLVPKDVEISKEAL